MNRTVLISILVISIVSCNMNAGSPPKVNNILQLLPDTTKNIRASVERDRLLYELKMEHQLGLTDLEYGADSLEIRFWDKFAFNIFEDLYVLNFRDSTCIVSVYHVHCRTYNNEKPDRNWNLVRNPIVDSFEVKSKRVPAINFKWFPIDSVWNLKSQSELRIPDSVGFTDCNNYSIKVADKKRFKYVSQHCPRGYLNKLNFPEIKTFIDFCESITILAHKEKIHFY